MLAVCTSYGIDFLKRHMKRQHAAVVTIQSNTDLEGCIQPHHGVMDNCRQKVSERCTDQYIYGVMFLCLNPRKK